MDRSTQIVSDGYDQIKAGYSAWIANSPWSRIIGKRNNKLAVSILPDGASICDLGCGDGTTLKFLSKFGFQCTGVELSCRTAGLAMEALPDAQIHNQDMMNYLNEATNETFDCVLADFSIIHLDRTKHQTIFSEIWRILKPNGFFVGFLGATDMPEMRVQHWIGSADMYWSWYDTQTNLNLLKNIGFNIVNSTEETVEEFGQNFTFLNILASKS